MSNTNEIGRTMCGALNWLRDGLRVCREGWNGKGMWLGLQTPDANSKMTLPYIFMRTAQGDLVPWLASQTDLLATDWEVFNGRSEAADWWKIGSPLADDGNVAAFEERLTRAEKELLMVGSWFGDARRTIDDLRKKLTFIKDVR